MSNLSDLTSQCIRCGFCIESCPTFQITSDESQSPRGRITLVREAHDAQSWSQPTVDALDTCLGCRACETACPSGVKYGKILELARSQTKTTRPRLAQKIFVNTLTKPSFARIQFALGGLLPSHKMPKPLSRILCGDHAEAEVPSLPTYNPWPALNEEELPAIKGEVYLVEGCVMRVLYPQVHEATRRLLRRVGFKVKESNAGCCGALHAHAGYLTDADAMAQNFASNMPEKIPVIVNSAGCGSTIKEYGQVIGHGLSEFSVRTYDVCEFLKEHGLGFHLATTQTFSSMRVAYHEACHLVHGQKVSSAPKELLFSIPGVEVVDFYESDMCCGSAGTYNIFQPKLARKLLNRKWKNICESDPHTIVTGNPGCQSWIAQANFEDGNERRVLHTVELLESAFSGLKA